MNYMNIIGNKSKEDIGKLVNPIRILLKNEIPVFMFHRIMHKENTDKVLDKSICLDVDSFEEFIVLIKEYFEIGCLKKLQERKYFPNKNSCIITFDDGWLDNYQVAFPILKKHSVPATIFLPTRLVGTNNIFWFEKLEKIMNAHSGDINNLVDAINEFIPPGYGTVEYDPELKNLHSHVCYIFKKMHPNEIEIIIDQLISEYCLSDNDFTDRALMNWEEVHEMSRHNITFGSHGLTHSIFPRLDYDGKYQEISESRKELLSKNLNFVNCLSFPNGNYDQETLDIALQVGYSIIFSASINNCGRGKSPILVHRICISEMNSTKNMILFSLLKGKIKGKFRKSKEIIIKSGVFK